MDHYERLKISRDAPLEVIRAAYRALAAKHHPDRHGQSEGANTDMAALNAAYEVLCDPDSRAAYEASLATAGGAGRRSPVMPEQTDIDWAALLSKKPAVNPWATRKRLLPLGLVFGFLVLGCTVWWSQDVVKQMTEERLLAKHYKAVNPTRDLAAEAMERSQMGALGSASASASAAGPLAPTAQTRASVSALNLPLPIRTPLSRHPLDGDPLQLKPEGELFDPLAKP